MNTAGSSSRPLAVVAETHRDHDAREPIPTESVLDDEDPPAADCVVFWTGWDGHWRTAACLDHPYLEPAAAERCSELQLAVGTDILNPDPTPTVNVAHEEPDGFVAHHALLDGNWLIFENFTNLSAVSERFELRAYPMKRSGGGAPVRAIGVPQE